MEEHRLQRRLSAGESVTRLATLDESARTVEFVASTEAIDSHRSIVRQSWNLERFRANPVVLYCHDPDDPIGTAEVRVEPGVGLVANVRFAENDECAEKAWNLVKQGVLRGMSVGFRPGKVSVEKINEADIVVYENCELLELSVVSVPSNAQTLAREAELSPAEPGPSTRSNMSNTPEAPSAVPSSDPSAPQSPPGDPGQPILFHAADAISRAEHESVKRALESTIAEQQKSIASLEARAVAAEERAGKLDEERLSRKVEDLVGTKIQPAQRDVFLTLARQSEASFDAVVSTLPDLKLTGERVMPEQQAEVRQTDVADAKLRKLEELTRERMKTHGESRNAAMRVVMQQNPQLCADDAA